MFPLQPLNFLTDQGEAAGVYPDVIAATAAAEGWSVQYVQGSWSECLDRLVDGEIDLMTTIAYSADRAQVMDYSSEAVCDIWGQVFVRLGGGVADLRDLDGELVGIMRRDINGANFIDLTRRLGVACRIREYGTHEDVFKAIQSGVVKAGVVPQHYGLRHATAYDLVGSSIQFAPFSVFFAVRKGINGDLLTALDRTLRQAKSDPESFYYESLQRWMGSTTVERSRFPVWLLVAAVAVAVVAAGSLAFNKLLNAKVRQRTREVIDRENEYATLAENAKCMIMRFDGTGTILSMNRYGLKILGYARSEVVGQPVMGFVVPFIETDGTDLRKQAADAFANPDRYITHECEVQCKDGQRLFIQWTSHNSFDDDGNLSEVLKIGIDITERRRLTDELNQARKMEAIGTLAGGVAHDFNNMLAGIVAAADILRMRTDDDLHRYIDVIRKSGERAATLIRQMLAFSRQSEQGRGPVDLRAVIEDAVGLLSRSIDKKTKIEVDCPDEARWVTGDAAQLENIVINMGVNASHAMEGDGGGELRIATEAVTIDQDCRMTGADLMAGSYIKLTISDEGHGIPAETIARIFDPFFTTKAQGKGTGLGLAAVFGAVTAHGGSIEVASTEGVGTTFSIYLPASAVPPAPLAEPSSGGHPLRSGRALVIDDEAMVRDMVAAMLETLGFEVVQAEHGQAGLDRYDEADGAFDVIILDMIMPVLDGRQTFVGLRERQTTAPIILASGYAEDSSIEAMWADGLAAYLVKPYTLSDLRRAIDRALESPT